MRIYVGFPTVRAQWRGFVIELVEGRTLGSRTLSQPQGEVLYRALVRDRFDDTVLYETALYAQASLALPEAEEWSKEHEYQPNP